MKNILKYAGVFLGAILFSASVASAVSTLIVQQGGTGINTAPISQLLYGSGTNPFASVATTSVTCSGNTSCSTFTAIGSSPVTITSSGGSSSTFGTSSLSALLPLVYTQSSSLAQFSTLFTTTTETGIGHNLFIYTNNNGVLTGAASSSLSLPNAALQNSSITVNGTTFNLGDSKTITAASSTLLSDFNTFTHIITGSITGNAGTATALATGRTLSITGDLTYTSPTFDGSGNVTAAGTLATVNSNVGSFTNANVTVNAKGLITAVSNGSAGGSTFGQAFDVDASNWLSATTTNTYGINANTSGITYGYGIGDRLLAYASSTNLSTLLGFGAGGQNSTTSATVASTTAIGYLAGNSLTTGFSNAIIGSGAGLSLKTGNANVILGGGAYTNGTGSNNIEIGYNVAGPQTTGNGNIIIGTNVGLVGTVPGLRLDIGNVLYGNSMYANNATFSNAPVSAGAIGIATSSGGNLPSTLVVGGNQSIGADYQFAAPANGLIVEGNTGIGTTSPTHAFEVHGTAFIDNTLTLSNLGAGALTTSAAGVVSAGTLSIGNGGTGQTSASAAFNVLSPLTTSGDMLYGGASGAGTRLAIGTPGFILASLNGIPTWVASTTISNISAFKQASNYATTGALPANTYLSGVLTEVGTGALTVDGASPSIGQRILVKNEATQTNNGIYTVTATGSGIAAYVLTRATDFNTSDEIYPGVATYILTGTANGDTTWVVTSTPPVVLDTTNIIFAESANGNITLPISVANGGTGATSFTTTGNSVYWDGSKLATALTTTAVLTPFASSTVASIADSSTVASTSLETTTGNIFLVHSVSSTIASSTLAYDGAFGASGSTTLIIANPLHTTTIKSIFCTTDIGTAWVGFGNGTATTTEVQCNNTGKGVTVSSNNVFAGRKPIYMEIGTSASAPNNITPTVDLEDSN